MVLDPPKYPQAQCVLTFTAPALREPSRDNAIIQTLESEFPNVISRPIGQSAPNVPLVLASGSAQLSIGPAQAEFGVGFYGEYVTSLEGVIRYLRTKLGSVLSTLNGVDVHVLTAGVILVAQYPFAEGSTEQVLRHLLETQIRTDVPVDDVVDVQVRLGLKVRDTHYVSLGVSNYESRSFRQMATPAMPVISIRPWEGEVTERGVQLVVDVNNRLAARQADADRLLDEGAMGEILDVAAVVAEESGPAFLETGLVSSASIEGSLEAAR